MSLPLLSWAPGLDEKREGLTLILQGLTLGISFLGISSVPGSLGISKTHDLIKLSEQLYKMTQNILRFIDEETKVRRVMLTFKSKRESHAGTAAQHSSQSSGCGTGWGEVWCWTLCTVEEGGNAGFLEIVRLFNTGVGLGQHLLIGLELTSQGGGFVKSFRGWWRAHGGLEIALGILGPVV